MKKKVILSLLVILTFAFSGTGWAAEKPFGDITRAEAIKLFKDRTLDPIEGIWSSGLTEILIVKSSLLGNRKPDDTSDYTVVTIDCYYQSVYNRHEVVAKLNKGELANIFNNYILINPTTLSRALLSSNSYSRSITSETFVRIYPSPL